MIKFEDVEPPEEGGPDPLALLVQVDQNLIKFEDVEPPEEGGPDQLDMDLQDLKEEPDLSYNPMDAHTTS